MSWNWLERETVLAIHAQQIAEHGGAQGLRDMGLLESALARPCQLAAYGKPSLYGLAAAYAWGIARNHPFIDGNKRTAYVSCMLFLRLHGARVWAGGPEKVLLFVRLGKGEISQEELALWLKERSSPPAS
ncbi:MAG: type II toxin-antitoxin system death-on-curing family toxin [Thermodesulfobacteriota bacterium]